MALLRVAGKFTVVTSDNGNKSITGLGFQPKFIIFYWLGITSGSDTAGAGNVRNGFGFAVSSTSQAMVNNFTQNNQASGQAACRISDTLCMATIDGNGGEQFAASLVSMDSDGFTINITNTINNNMDIMYIAFGGDDITNAKAGVYQAGVSAGNVSITGVGFQPDFLFVASASQLASIAAANNRGNLSFGATDGVNQRVSCHATVDGAATMDTTSYTSDAEFMAEVTDNGAQGIENRQSIVSFDSDGWTFNQLETEGAYYSIYLAVEGGSWAIGDLLTQTDTTTTVTESGLSFEPKALIFVSTNKPKSTQDAGDASGQFSFGLATSTSNRMAMGMQDEDNVDTSNVSFGIEHDEVYMNINTADAVQGLGDVTAFNSDGFTFIMDDADPQQNYVWWIAAGDSGGAPPSTPVAVFYRHLQTQGIS